MRKKDFGIWHDITWAEYLENVKHVALGLHALGVKYGEHVAIIGENRPEWLYSALGIVCAGGAWVGVYTTNPVAVQFEFTDFDVRMPAHPRKFYRVRHP